MLAEGWRMGKWTNSVCRHCVVVWYVCERERESGKKGETYVEGQTTSKQGAAKISLLAVRRGGGGARGGREEDDGREPTRYDTHRQRRGERKQEGKEEEEKEKRPRTSA